MKASILRVLVVGTSLTVLGFMGVTVRNAYGQSSGSGMACCGGSSTPQTLNCGTGTHQVGTGSSASCVADSTSK
jgi:hypothetical protein